MQPILLILTYVVVVAAVVTGLLKLAFPKNNILKLLHGASGPLSNFLFAIHYLMFQLSESGPKLRVVLALCFMLLAYSGLVTGKPEPTKKQKIVHILAGILTLLAFSVVFFTFALLWTGLASSVSEFLPK